MGLKLVFNPEKLPRTMTKAEWKKCWRWKRRVEHELIKTEELELEALRSDIPRYIKVDIAARLINPPLLVFP